MATDRYKYFRIEAAELLDHLVRGVLALEKMERPDAGAVGALLRHAHTLKGAARVVRQLEIANSAHALEDQLSLLETNSGKPHVESLLRLLDTIGQHLATLNEPLKTTSDETRAAPVVRADVAQLTAVREGVTEALTELTQLSRDGVQLAALRELAELLERQSLTRRLTDARQYETLLSSIHTSVSEMLTIISRFGRTFETTLERVTRELQQTQSLAEQVQLVSVRSIFDSLERSVRDASVELRKDVRFEADGGDIKLDSHVLDVVHRALLHLVRNAVAHGIEARPVRVSSGKPNVGVVSVVVTRVDQRVCFSCRDDGQGVDVERLSSALRSVGSEVVSLQDDHDILRAMLRSGVSTATHVNSISGRGVGMSAVQEAAESIGATIQLRNNRGGGATFDVLVPTKLSTIAGLSVVAGDDVVVLPLHNVRRTLLVGTASLVNSGDKLQLRVDGSLIPFAPIRTLLHRDHQSRPRLAVLMECAGAHFAVGIDAIVGCQTQVMHRLPKEIPRLPLVDGAVFNARGLAEVVLNAESLQQATATLVWGGSPTKKPTLAPILVVDDSLTTRMLEQSILESAGYSVELATSAEHALEMAARADYSLFLVDVEMPGMDGFAFVETTRAQERLKQVPAVLISSRSAPADVARGRSAGAAAYIDKAHFDHRELLRQIEAILGE